ncbi:hypothetical protein CspeluHIS016_0400150 [Cutaneotrichosporon spelunceum]|uniref:Uncharacterized protein n=1 Tax=Cutaneotrichosporon spelunceum TaxID=1672016 RepID=A0AAD3TV96_9TREE|nr:hypothetical protein CspeluHIS016_0400150 [Cutaneotrichosporon spelunceum]
MYFAVFFTITTLFCAARPLDYRIAPVPSARSVSVPQAPLAPPSLPPTPPPPPPNVLPPRSKRSDADTDADTETESSGNESARPQDWTNTWEAGDWDDGPLTGYPSWEGVPFAFTGDWDTVKGMRAQIALLEYMIGVASRLDLHDLVTIWEGEIRRLRTAIAARKGADDVERSDDAEEEDHGEDREDDMGSLSSHVAAATPTPTNPGTRRSLLSTHADDKADAL